MTYNITTSTNQIDEGTTTYTLWIDGEDASELTIWTTTREIANIETRAAHQGEGFARALYEHASAEEEIFHALEHHRTPEGHAFAEAMGGETIDEEDGKVDVCSTCNGDFNN